MDLSVCLPICLSSYLSIYLHSNNYTSALPDPTKSDSFVGWDLGIDTLKKCSRWLYHAAKIESHCLQRFTWRAGYIVDCCPPLLLPCAPPTPRPEFLIQSGRDWGPRFCLLTMSQVMMMVVLRLHFEDRGLKGSEQTMTLFIVPIRRLWEGWVLELVWKNK